MPPDLTNIPGTDNKPVAAERVPGAPLEPTDKHPVQLLNELSDKAVEYEMVAKVGQAVVQILLMVF